MFKRFFLCLTVLLNFSLMQAESIREWLAKGSSESVGASFFKEIYSCDAQAFSGFFDTQIPVGLNDEERCSFVFKTAREFFKISEHVHEQAASSRIERACSKELLDFILKYPQKFERPAYSIAGVASGKILEQNIPLVAGNTADMRKSSFEQHIAWIEGSEGIREYTAKQEQRALEEKISQSLDFLKAQGYAVDGKVLIPSSVPSQRPLTSVGGPSERASGTGVVIATTTAFWLSFYYFFTKMYAYLDKNFKVKTDTSDAK